MREEIEEIVLEKIKTGDFRACSYIVDKYKNYVFNIAFKILRVREDAEEGYTGTQDFDDIDLDDDDMDGNLAPTDIHFD